MERENDKKFKVSFFTVDLGKIMKKLRKLRLTNLS